MKLSNIIQKLNVGALTSVAITNEGAGIKEIDYPQICSHINDFVSDFYVRFHLRYKEIVVRAVEGMNEYHLHSDFAESNVTSNEPVKYIIDSPENPFTDDIAAIRSITSTCSKQFVINDANDKYSVFLTDFDRVQFPVNFFEEGMGFSVIYEAVPPELALDTAIDLSTEIRLPSFATKALTTFIEGTIFLNMGGNNINKGVALRNISEEEVRKIEREGLLPPKDVQINLGEREGGWI